MSEQSCSVFIFQILTVVPYLNRKFQQFSNIFIPSEVDAFVSNQSTIAITEPDLFQDPNEVISYEIDRTNTEIEATCTGYGGNPEPTFHW